MKKSTLVSNILALAAAVLAITYFFPHPQANHYKFEEGRPWNYAKLIAPFDIPIRPDSATILAVRDSLERIFVPVFQRDPEAINNIITELMGQWSLLDADSEPAASEGAIRRKAVTYLRRAYSVDVISDEYAKRIDMGSLPNIKILQNKTLHNSNTRGFSSPQSVIEDMALAINADSLKGVEWIMRHKIADVLQPNLVYDQETSMRLYQNDLDRNTANTGVIQQGQTIIDKGAVITPQDYTNLLTYESMVDEQMTAGGRSEWLIWLGEFLYVLLIVLSLGVYLYYTAPQIWQNKSAVAFIALVITLFFIIGVAVDAFIDQGIYLVPFAIVPVLMIVFFDAPAALMTALTLILLCSGAVSFPLEFIIVQMLAAVSAVYSLKELTKRLQLLRTSLYVMASYLLSYVSIELMLNGAFSSLSWHMIVFLAISAALTSMAYILMVAVEHTFGFVSVVTLIELTDTNNPLLRDLSQECPGTFQHSMAVSNLATDAAIKIGANEQLVRAGALYHDIGKMSNPNFFTENQRSVNPHDALPAEQSARIIISHVTDGLQRADKAGLPEIIKDFISQHHGKGKAKYFYYNYCNQHPDEQVDPAPFTYPGPNPQSREASVLMMADSVEAASRSLQEHTPESIKALVDKIIDGQIADGLHNDSPLMFKDIETIKQAFVRRLATMYHSRVTYPDAPKP